MMRIILYFWDHALAIAIMGGIKSSLYSDGNNYLILCRFCMFAHWQRNEQSIILMVGLFEQWETE